MTSPNIADSQSSHQPEKEKGFFDDMSPKEALKFKIQLLGLGAIVTAAVIATPTALIWHGVDEGKKAKVKAEQIAQDQLHQKGIMLGFTAVEHGNASISLQPIKTVTMSAADFGHLPYHMQDNEGESAIGKIKLGQAQQYSGVALNSSRDGFLVYGRLPGSGLPYPIGSAGGSNASKVESYQLIPMFKAKNQEAASQYMIEVVAANDSDIQAGAVVDKEGWMDLVIYNPLLGDDTEVIAALHKK